MGRVIRWGATYFAILFGIGFVLGTFRVLWLEPRLGVRLAQLLEAPLMFAAIVLVGRWIGQRLGGVDITSRLSVGALAAACILAADLLVGVGLRNMTVVEVFTLRDPISGSVYYLLVAFTAVAPCLGRDVP